MSPVEPIDGDGRIDANPAPVSVFDTLGGFVRTLGNCTPDHPQGRALLAACARMGRQPWVAGDACDPLNTDQAWERWIREWVRARAAVYVWWRVENEPGDAYPGPPLPAIPNPEQPHEYARLPSLLARRPSAIVCPGKAAGIDVELLAQRGVDVFAECFRETPASDHTITNSHAWWEARGYPMRRWRPALQAYGTPFASLFEQAKDARHVGCRGAAIYPLDGADPAGVRAVGEVLA